MQIVFREKCNLLKIAYLLSYRLQFNFVLFVQGFTEFIHYYVFYFMLSTDQSNVWLNRHNTVSNHRYKYFYFLLKNFTLGQNSKFQILCKTVLNVAIFFYQTQPKSAIFVPTYQLTSSVVWAFLFWLYSMQI